MTKTNNKEKILVINPVENYTLKLKTMFEKKYDAIKLENGRDAVELLEQLSGDDLPVAIIVDGFSFFWGEGWEVIEYRNSHPALINVPVIAVGDLPDGDENNESYEEEFLAPDREPGFFAVQYTDNEETVKRTVKIIEAYRSAEYQKRAQERKKEARENQVAAPQGDEDGSYADMENAETYLPETIETTEPEKKTSIEVGDIFYRRIGYLCLSVQFILVKDINEDDGTMRLSRLDYVETGETDFGRQRVEPAPYDSADRIYDAILPLFAYNPEEDIIVYDKEKICADGECSCLFAEESENQMVMNACGRLEDTGVLHRHIKERTRIFDEPHKYFRKGDIFYRSGGEIEFFEVAKVEEKSIKLYPIESEQERCEGDACYVKPIPHRYVENTEFDNYVNINASHLHKRFSAYDKESDCFPAKIPSMSLRRYDGSAIKEEKGLPF